MKRYLNFGTLILILLVGLSCEKQKSKVLIIGDSISIGYTPFVKENLVEVADVFHNRGNAQHTGTGMDSLVAWVGETPWDVIHFNWGLWDLCYRHPDSKVQGKRDKVNGKITFSTMEYESNLRGIVSRIKEISDAKLIFVTTSYVPEKEAGRYATDAPIYNEVAKKIMNDNEIIVNDIYEKSIQIHQQYGKGNDDVHYTPVGYEMLAQEISRFIENEIR